MAWQEIRQCLSVGTYTAAVMMCRKLLLHVEVAQGLPAKNDKDSAPTFAQVNSYLEDEGVITNKMRPWVDRIKDMGNDGAHEITPITENDAMAVARYAEQLLRMTYELVAPENEAPLAELMGRPPSAPHPVPQCATNTSPCGIRGGMTQGPRSC